MATTSVDWTCPGYRRLVAACLVNGAYALERDRRKNRQDAPAWWEKYHFELKRKLTDHDDADSSIFGAIYEFKPPTVPIQNAPKIVIALRGTQLKWKTFWLDIKLDLEILVNGLERTRRCEKAMSAVEEMISADASRNLWLAGHSLGSAIAMIAGKNLAKRGINLETFLFNPPYPSAIPIELIESKTVKQVVGVFSSILTAGVAFKEGRREQSRDYFVRISAWVPYLFVNSDDIICSGYIGYFERRENMEDFGLGSIERLATRNSVRALACGSESEPFDLLPSAKLVVNSLHTNIREDLNPLKRMKQALKRMIQAHGIDQWLSQDLSLQSKEHHYN